MVSHRWIKQYLGQHVQCHTPYGTFHGVLVQATKSHLILAPVSMSHRGVSGMNGVQPDYRPFPMGPGGPGPGGPMGPGGPGGPGGPMGPGGGGGGGWHVAIPLAAILGVTALGLHWW